MDRRIGDFVVEERIGRGGMATVFRARQLSVNRYVALKLIDISADDSGRQEIRKRFEQEVSVVAMLEHIHILPIYGHGIIDDQFAYLAMRLLNGGSLSDLLHRGPLPLNQTADILAPIAQALSYAHSRGVIHRDLKPSNILLDDAGNAYLSDFGLARVVGQSLGVTNSDHLVGTPTYVAPEQVRGEPADQRSDIYNLGIILYHMIVGRPPFEMTESGIGGLLYRHLEAAAPPPSSFNPRIPPQIDAIVLKALEKHPNDRHQTAEELANELLLALDRPPLTWQSQSVFTRSLRRRIRLPQRLPGSRLLVALAVIATAVVLAFVFRPQPAASLTTVTIAREAHGTRDDVIPSANEIARAQAQLGSGGFIAHMACALDNIFQAERARMITSVAAEYNLPIRVYNPENDVYTQITQIEQARIDGAKAFIICPLGTDALDDTLDGLAEAQVPVTFITLFDHPYGVKLDSNNYDIGYEIGSLTGELLQEIRGGQGNVVVLENPNFPASQRRVEGAIDGVEARAPDANVLGTWAGFTRDTAFQSIKRLLDEGTTIDAVIATADIGAYGAIDALNEAGFAPDEVIVASANGESFAQDLIRTGYFLRGTVAVNTAEVARLSVDATIKMLASSSVPEVLAYPPGELLTQETLAAAEDS